MKHHSIYANVFAALFLSFAFPCWADFVINENTTFTSGEPVPVNGTLTVDGNFTIGENQQLVLTGVSAIGGSATISGEAGSVLDIEITKDITQPASSWTLDGALSLVKSGSGKFTPQLTQTYTGKTKIKGGTLSAPDSSKSLNTAKNAPWGGKPNTIEIVGGVLDIRGYYVWKGNYDILLSGGKIVNTISMSGKGEFNPDITVTEDSSFSNTGSTCNFSPTGDLGGKTLTIDNTKTIKYKPAFSNGTVCLNSGTLTLADNVGVLAEGGKPSASLTLNAGTSIDFGTFTYSVLNYTANTSGTVGSGALNVYGTFKPNSDQFYAPTMQNGSTIDLSSVKGAWSIQNAASESVMFAENAQVKIAFGEEMPALDTEFLTWTVEPAESVKFALAEEYSNLGLEKSSTGLKLVWQGEELITSAVWTGAGNDGDIANPANWTCTGSSGSTIPEKLPGEMTAVTIPVSALATTSFAEELKVASVTISGEVESIVLDNDRDWSGLGPMDFPCSIDLNGHTLAFVLAGETQKELTVNSTEQGGELKLSIPEGTTYNNSMVSFTGDFAFVKDGAGTFIAAKNDQAYTGGTTVKAGALKATAVALDADGVTPFGSEKTLTLEGGAFDPAGAYNWSAYTICFAGGSIENTVESTGLSNKGTTATTENPFDPKLTIDDAATIKTVTAFNFCGTISSESKTLVLDIAEGCDFFWGRPTCATDLTLIVKGGGNFKVFHKYAANKETQPGMTLVMEEGSLNLFLKTDKSDYPATCEVSNYVAKASADSNSNGGVLNVYGTFTPVAASFFGCTMMDGSVIDLSGKTAVWSTTSSAEGKNTVEFAEDATVTIALGSRTLGENEQVVAWVEKPTKVTFTFAGDNVDQALFAVTDEGIFYNLPQDEVASAKWTGGGDPKNLKDPKNWACYNAQGDLITNPEAIPDENATIVLEKALGGFTLDSSFAFASLKLENVALDQAETFDGFDLNKLTDDSVLDLCGYDLTIKCVPGTCETAAMVTNSAAQATLTFEVAEEDAVYTNSGLLITGNIQVKKTGEGIFVAAKYPQAYFGDTIVREGVLRCVEKMDMNTEKGESPFGTNHLVRVEASGVLDPAGSCNWDSHTIEFAGGLVSNTVESTGLKNTNYNSTIDKRFNPKFTLAEGFSAARLATTEDFNFMGSAEDVELTLVVPADKNILWNPSSATGVVLKVIGGGDLKVWHKANVLRESVGGFDLNLEDAGLNLSFITKSSGNHYDATLEVDDYTANSTKGSTEYGILNVYGVFKPNCVDGDGKEYFYGCTMMDGSTIDLSGKTATWLTTSSSEGKNTVSFADEAKIKVKVGGKPFSTKEPVLAWTEGNEPASSVEFLLDEETLANGFKLERREDGLYVVYSYLMLYLK